MWADVDGAEEEVEVAAGRGYGQDCLFPSDANRGAHGWEVAGRPGKVGRSREIGGDGGAAYKGGEARVGPLDRELGKEFIYIAAEACLAVVAGEGEQMSVDSDVHSADYNRHKGCGGSLRAPGKRGRMNSDTHCPQKDWDIHYVILRIFTTT